MVFSSPLFLGLFLPVLLVAYLMVPQARRNFVLLAGSLFFYAWWSCRFALLLVAAAGGRT